MNEFLDILATCCVDLAVIGLLLFAIYGAWLLIPRKYRDKITEWVNDMYDQIGE